MSEQQLRGTRACVFDAYGTLFDSSSAAQRGGDVIGSETAARLAEVWRNKQLQYTWLRTIQNRHADFWQVTGEALDFALETLAIADPALRERLMHGYLALDAYPEAAAAVGTLRGAGKAMAILSILRLGGLMELPTGVSTQVFNELLAGMRIGAEYVSGEKAQYTFYEETRRPALIRNKIRENKR